jgi:hypothetical protein
MPDPTIDDNFADDPDDVLDEPKPCVEITCPPLTEYQIDAIIPPRDYVPGAFAREVAAFYGLPDPFPDAPDGGD